MNTTIFYFFYNLGQNHPTIGKAAVFFGGTFPYIVMLFAFIFLVFHHEVLPSRHPFKDFMIKWREILAVFLTSAFAWVVAKLLKLFIHTHRPFIAFPNVHALLSESGYAFPSGHATFFMALAMAIFFHHKKTGYVFMFFALLIGVARIIAGVHFPGDILGGYVLGAIIAYFLRS